MDEILAHLCETSGVTGSLLVGRDGLVIASHLRGGEDPDLLGAVIADLFGAVGGAVERLAPPSEVQGGGQAGQDGIELVSVERQGGKVFLQHMAEANALLSVLAGPKVNMGLVRMEMKEASQKLKDLLL